MSRVIPAEGLRQRLHSLTSDVQSLRSRIIPDDIPKKWEKFDDVAIIPSKSFRDSYWEEVPSAILWQEVASDWRRAIVPKGGGGRAQEEAIDRATDWFLLGDHGSFERKMAFDMDMT